MKKLGQILFILGAAILAVCALSMLKWKELEARGFNLIFSAFIASALLIVVGEILKYYGHKREKKMGRVFMDYYRVAKTTMKSRKKDVKYRCSFCNLELVPPGSSKDNYSAYEDRQDQVQICVECGKMSCPQCAFRKGLEMGLKSLRCPSCGGKVS